MTDKVQQNTTIDRKEYLQYAFNSTTAKQMSDDMFLDCATFISKQINVNDLEDIRKTFDTNTEDFRKTVDTITKNNEPISLPDRIKIYTKLLSSLLLIGLFCFIVMVVCYAMWYMKKDTVKSIIGMRLLLLIFGIGIMFLTFVFLYYMIMIQSKKIMLLL
jgi:hypothetical protein